MHVNYLQILDHFNTFTELLVGFCSGCTVHKGPHSLELPVNPIAEDLLVTFYVLLATLPDSDLQSGCLLESSEDPKNPDAAAPTSRNSNLIGHSSFSNSPNACIAVPS